MTKPTNEADLSSNPNQAVSDADLDAVTGGGVIREVQPTSQQLQLMADLRKQIEDRTRSIVQDLRG